MVSVVIISIGVMGFIGAFEYINKAIHVMRAKTLANNLAQEKIESLKNLSYYLLLVTTATATDTRVSPSVEYDTGYYPKESISVGGIAFERMTHVAFASVGGTSISTVPFTSDDPGLKRIQVHVIWSQLGQWKSHSLTNLLENPNVNPLDAGLSGTVSISGGGGLEGAAISVIENSNWKGTSGSGGQYGFSVAKGSYTLLCSSTGFFTAISGLTAVDTGESAAVNFTLTRIASGTVSGSAWINDHLVLSQVVGSTVNSSGFSQEYVEIFNPTTYTWTVNGEIGLKFQRPADTGKKTILINHASDTIAPGGFYLFANTGTVTAGGTTVSADAVWSDFNSVVSFPYFSTDKNIIPTSNQANEGGGAVELYRLSDDSVLDQMGWDRNNGSQTAPFSETEGLDENIGLQEQEQYLRYSSTSGVSSVYGPAYDSGNNDTDWRGQNPISTPPRTSVSPAQTVIAGVPAAGAVAFSGDGLSAPASASLTGDPPYAQFTLTRVATGTWTVGIASGSATRLISNVSVLYSSVAVLIPNASTDPAWPVSENYSVFLSSSAAGVGYVSGFVKDGNNVGINAISVTSPGIALSPANTSSSGFYFLALSTGLQTVIFNQNNQNSSYVSELATAEISEGLNTTLNVNLSKGGTLKGYITSGSSPLPAVTATANLSGAQMGAGASDDSGYFYIQNISTGTYSVAPVVDPAQDVSPDSLSAAVVSASTVFVGTFTVTSAFAEISGTVKSGGSPITTGVLIIASTGAISSPPPAIYASSAAAQTIYYSVSSLSDGTYSLLVRGTTQFTYGMSAFYTEGSVTEVRTASGLSATPSGSVTQNFTW